MSAFQAVDGGSIPPTRTKNMRIESIDTVVFSDLHGRVDRFDQIRSIYGNDVRYISAGDVVDGSTGNTCDLIEKMGESGVLMAAGNHELITSAVMLEGDEDVRGAWFQVWRNDLRSLVRSERGTLKSYGIDESLSNYQAAEKLACRMDELGHLALIKEAELFFETDDYIVIHAGLTAKPWKKQRASIESKGDRIRSGDYSKAPIQVMDPRFRLADYGSPTPTKKTVITGHAHLTADASERSTCDGKRIRLGSKLQRGEPVYVWQSWDNEVVELK